MRKGGVCLGASVLLASGLGGGLLAAQAPERYDLVVRGARVVDGTGSPWYRADVAVRGDTIAAVGRALRGTGEREVDARGHVVSPGFIDVHTHARRRILDVPTADNYLHQGVTTLVEGLDGGSPVPLEPFLDGVAAARPSVNLASFIGQGSVRREVMGDADRAASAQELERMKALVREGMEQGALGLSTGLFYVPGAFASTEEVIALARVAGELGGIHTSHMRDEASQVVESVRETIRIGEEGGLPTHVTHHKTIGPANRGRSRDTLRLVDEARTRGVDVTIDQYPYTASSTSIQGALWPKWAQAGGREAILERLADPQTRERIQRGIAAIIENERGGGDARNVVISQCEWDAALAGKTLADVTRQRGAEPTLETSAATAIWIVEQGGCRGVFHAINEDDLERILVHPATMIASDGGVQVFGEAQPHPRSYGTFPRVLGRYVREQGLLALEEAVRKMTALPAQRIGLADRGVIKVGAAADLVVWDPATIRDTATFEEPHRYAEGVQLMVVNGRIALEAGRVTTARPGRVLTGPAARRTYGASAGPPQRPASAGARGAAPELPDDDRSPRRHPR